MRIEEGNYLLETVSAKTNVPVGAVVDFKWNQGSDRGWGELSRFTQIWLPALKNAKNSDSSLISYFDFVFAWFWEDKIAKPSYTVDIVWMNVSSRKDRGKGNCWKWLIGIIELENRGGFDCYKKGKNWIKNDEKPNFARSEAMSQIRMEWSMPQEASKSPVGWKSQLRTWKLISVRFRLHLPHPGDRWVHRE